MKDPTEMELYLQYGIDLKARRIYFSDPDSDTEITNRSVGLAIRAIDRMIQENPDKPIELHVMSYGGDPYAILGLYDKIQESPCKFEFHGRGGIMSAAVLLLCACDERIISANSTIMMHEGTTNLGEKSVTDLAINAEEDARLMRLIVDILASRTFVDSKEFWLNIARRDLYVSPQEALLLGLADKIEPYRKRGNFRQATAHLFKTCKPNKKQLKSIFSRLAHRVRNIDIQSVTIRLPQEEYEEQTPAVQAEEQQNGGAENGRVPDGSDDQN